MTRAETIDVWGAGDFRAPVSLPVEAAIRAAARRAYPVEMCGVVVRGEFIGCRNVAGSPHKAFKIDQAEFGRYLRAGLDAVVHSHPNDFPAPSEADMQQQIAQAVPWGVVGTDGREASEVMWWGDQLPGRRKLVGRGFCHAVTDCYSLIRDYYEAVRGVDIPDYPRDWAWWEDGKNLYADFFGDAGFRRIGQSEARAGDVFLAQVGRKAATPNHGGIYLGGGLILHHLTARRSYDPSRLSKREPIGGWAKHVTHWLRYEGERR